MVIMAYQDRVGVLFVGYPLQNLEMAILVCASLYISIYPSTHFL